VELGFRFQISNHIFIKIGGPFTLSRTMSVERKRISVSFSPCGVVWCGVVWCGLPGREAHYCSLFFILHCLCLTSASA